MSNVAIVLNAPNITAEVTEKDVIYADGGYRFRTDNPPVAVVGDFDSYADIPTGVRVVKHSAEKNYTDGEAAMRLAAELGYKSVTIYGALGGRIDHVIGNLALLSLAEKLGMNAVICEKNVKIYYCADKFSLNIGTGKTLSVLPYCGAATVTNTCGLYYPLLDLKLQPFDTRGISNVTTSDTFSLEVVDGGVLIICYI